MKLRHCGLALAATLSMPVIGVTSLAAAAPSAHAANTSAGARSPVGIAPPLENSTPSTETRSPAVGSPQSPQESTTTAAIPSSRNVSDTPALVGPWNGGLDVGGYELRLDAVFTFEDRWLAGTLDIPQQDARHIKLTGVHIEGQKVHFEILVAPSRITFDGTLEGDRITGSSAQAGRSMPFHLERGTVAAAANHPYLEEEVAFPNGSLTLAGTLTRPKGASLPPAVILISGSGPQNRDEFMVGLEPFKAIADYYASRGIAVLRVDDRGVGGSSGDFNAATTLDFATDVEAALRFLKARRDIDPNQIGLLGHSEGGLIAPLVAERNHDVAFVILMGAPGLRGSEIVREQAALVSRASGLTPAQIQASDALYTKVFAQLEAGKSLAPLKDEFIAVSRSAFSVMSEEDKAQIGTPERLAAQQMQALESPWFKYFIGHDPRPELEKVRCPVLAVNGGLDLQVPAKSNLKAIADALSAGRNRDFRTLELPGLNHLFQKAVSGRPAEYATLPKVIDASFLQVTTDWIREHTGLGRQG